MGRTPISRKLRVLVAAAASLFLIASVVTPTVAFASAPPQISLAKTVAPAPPTALHPGDTATYSFNVECSSLDSQCDGFSVTDTIPAPLVLGAVSSPSGIKSTTVKSGNTFTVNFIQPLEDGNAGLDAGHQVGFTVTASVPAGVSADYDGQTITNTATASATNVPTPVTSSADVLLAVPQTLAATVGKTFTPSTLVSAPGKTSTIAIAVGNTSNTSVDSMTVQDPSALSATSFKYVAITGVSVGTWPGGANQVRVDYSTNGTTFTNGTFASSAALPSGVDPTTIVGLRFVFQNSSGKISQGATGTINIATALRPNVSALTTNTNVTNIASNFVTAGVKNSTTVTKSATLAISHVSIAPGATKVYTANSILGGVGDEATLTGTNGGQYTLTKLVVNEPAASTPTLADQGLTFTAWDNAKVEWPVGATAATIQYLYAGAGGTLASAQTMTRGSAMPVPDSSKTVIGFTATFTGTILASQYATLPFTFGTSAVSSDVAKTNTMSVDVTTDDNQTAEATAAAVLTLRSARINTSVSKSISPNKVYSVPGATTVVSLPGQVDPQPTGAVGTTGSTVGANSLTVQDPQTPGTSDFWDDFNAAAIVATDVPAGVTMSVNYWDVATSSWLPLTGATVVTGAQSFTYKLTSEQQDAADGLQFVYTPDAGTLLPPGFSVQPNIKAVLRTGKRSDSTAPNSSTTDTVVVANAVKSIATSVSTTPGTVTANNTANVSLLPVKAGGGLDLISKAWKTNGSTGVKYVRARTGDQATAVLDWGTGSLGFNSVVVSDTSDETPSLANVGDSVYDAFDLQSIPAITSSMDPELQWDEVKSVQLYIPGTGWTATATNPCAGTACDRTFPGYTLTSTESANAIGFRITFVESPTRILHIGSNPNAPTVGSGVAATTDKNREIDLVFGVRDTKRSDGSAVLGTTAGTVYNISDNPGNVLNSARIDALDVSDSVQYTDTASDTISILDQPANVNATKSWGDGATGGSVLGVPPDGTPTAFYPTATLTIAGQNTSVEKVDQLSLAEPTQGTTPFDYVNITKIDSISVPTGADSSLSTVVLSPSSAYPTPYTIAQALALSSDDLADATGIVVTHQGRIAGSATTTVQLETQLRATIRGSSDPVLADDVTSLTVHNTTTASITDPAVLTPSDHTKSADASAQIDIDSFNYGVTAGKSIAADTTATPTNPAIQYDGSSTNPTVTLTGQPSGNVPTTRMVIDDSTPTFWNAYNFTGFGALTFASPINRVQTDVLIGVPGALTPSTVTAVCSTDPAPCWVDGSSQSTLAVPTLPSGKTNADIRGVRFTFTKADYSAWERPHNPAQSVSFTVARRSTLVSPAGTPVASDLYTNTTPAPGETAIGTFTNTVTVTDAAATGPTDTNPIWSDTASDTKQITYHHLPAKVKIEKKPAGDWPLGGDIPYSIAVTNTGTSSDHDKVLGSVVVTDNLPGDSVGGPDLVLPSDPDTGNPETPAQVFSYTMTSGATVEPVPTVTAVMSPANSDGTQLITFTLASGQTIPLGWTLTINATLDFRAGLDAYTPVTNSATVTADQVFDTCDYFTNDIEQTIQNDVPTCTSATTTYPQPSAPLTIVKGVRGDQAGPLDASGNPLLDSGNQPYDDLGVLKTVSTSLNSCTTTNPALTVDGHGFYSYPCVPITRPGGNEEWVSQFTNGGNISLGEIVAIDVLPRQNDLGVIINSSRGSKWTPTLTSYPALHNLPNGATYQVYYTTQTAMATPNCNGADIQSTMGMTASTNPAVLPAYQTCLTSVPGSDNVPQRAAGWNLLSPTADLSTLATVVAMKFVVLMGDGLAPGHSIDITYESQTANNIDLPETTANLGRDSVAYNSIAGAAIGRYTNSGNPEDLPYPFVSEPRKVGVALATGNINLLKTVTGAAASLKPATNALDLSCKSNGVPVLLFDSTGASRTPFTVTPGSPLLVQGIPLYSVCTVKENTNYGQTVKTITNSPLVAEAAHTIQPVASPPTEIDNPHPAFDNTRPAIQQATVTNEYDNTDFTITKTVDTGGAVDAGGTAIAYTPPTMTAKCVFFNGVSTSTPLATTTFPLASGASKTFSALPAGSVCTVTEINSQLANSVSYTVTQNGVAASPVVNSTPTTTTTVATVTLAANSGGPTPTNKLAITNTYAVGSLQIVKNVSGQWGAGRTFAFSVVCTYTDNSTTPVTSTVYNGTFSLTAPNPITATPLTQTISNLPAGASCVVTETGAAGATVSRIHGGSASAQPTTTVVIAPSATGTATIDNEYDNATLTVSKAVHTSAADADGNTDYPNYSYAMSVACKFQGSDVWGDTFTASPMTFSLGHGDSKVITGLPTGAVCSVTENDITADSTTIDVATTSAASSVNGKTASITLTKDNPDGTNTAVVNNNYGVTSFTITKSVKGAGAAQFAASSFDVAVSCSSPGIVDAYHKTITLAAGGSKTINNLPENSICSAIELGGRNATGADSQTFVDSDGTTTGVGVHATLTTPGQIDITNWYLTGSLTVTKEVVGGGGTTYGGTSNQFEISLDCTRVNVAGDTVDVTIPGGGTRSISGGDSQTFTNLPSGALCTLTELNPGGATSSFVLNSSDDVVQTDATTGYAVPAIVVDPTVHSATDQLQPALTVKNDFDLASIAITKHVTSTAVDQAGTAVAYGTFPVAVKCTFPTSATTVYDDSKSIAKDETWTIPGLPAGADCTVTETDTMSAHTTDIHTVAGSDDVTSLGASTAELTLQPDAGHTANTATITNSYQAGSIQLTKFVTGAGATDWGNQPFTIGVDCILTDHSGVRDVFTKTYTVHRGDAPVQISNVATGAVCTVTESKTGAANTTTIALDGGPAATETTASFTSPAPGAAYDVDVTNEFDESSVKVTKNRIGDGHVLYGDGPFTVSLACKINVDGNPTDIAIPGGATRDLDADNGYKATYAGLPSGASCTPTETRRGGANSTELTPDHFTTDTSTPVDLEINNTFNVGGVTITKSFAGAGAATWGAGPFEVSLACTRQVNGATVDVAIPDGATRQLNSDNGYVASYENLPEGAICTPTETKTHGANSSAFDAPTVTVGSGVDTNLGLTNTFDIGSVVVNNTVTGGDAKHHYGDTFVVVLTCTQDIDGTVTNLEIPGGADRDIWHKTSIIYDDLPVGADCKLVETEDNHAEVVTIMWHGMPIPANSVVVGDPNFQIAVVNVFNVSLAFTGESAGAGLAVGILALLVGGILLLIRRRRNPLEAPEETA